MVIASSIKVKDLTNFKSLLDIFYPVGSVYISTVNTNPGSFLGGTWIAISSENAVLRASTTYGLTGSDTCTLTTSQIPSHTHTGPSHTHTTPAHKHNYVTPAWIWNEVNSSDWDTKSEILGPIKDCMSGHRMYIRATGNTWSSSGVDQGSGTTSASGTGSTSSAGGGHHTVSFNALSIVLCESALPKGGEL